MHCFCPVYPWVHISGTWGLQAEGRSWTLEGHPQSSEGARADGGMLEGQQGLDIKQGFPEVVP